MMTEQLHKVGNPNRKPKAECSGIRKRRFTAGVAALALMLGLTSVAVASTVTSFADDPTSTQYYFNFTVDKPVNAYRFQITDAAGTLVRNRTVHLSSPALSATHEVRGLTPDTRYRFQMAVRSDATGTWERGPRTRFRTNP